MKNSPNLRPRQNRRLSGRLVYRLIWTYAGAGILFALILLIQNNNPGFYNKGVFKINSIENFVIGTDMINDIGGTFTNSGQLVFHGNITNNAEMNCGDCVSGVNYLSHPDGEEIILDGLESVYWYDGILDNPGGLRLENLLVIQNSFSFLNGIVYTDRNTPEFRIHFAENAVIHNPGANAHVNGYISRSGEGEFTFPLGDGIHYRPISIHPASSADGLTATFAKTLTNSTLTPNVFPFNYQEPDDVEQIFEFGYWVIQGNIFSTVSLFWDNSTGFFGSLDDLDGLTILGWDGSQWINIGRESISGTLNEGVITSPVVDLSKYSAFGIGQTTQASFPLEWLGFEVKLKGDDAWLYWKTGNEQNVQLFDIERSEDGMIFNTIGETPALGGLGIEQNYEYVDQSVKLNNVPVFYYRLKQLDFDGMFEYSKVIELEFGKGNVKVKMNIFPNPTIDYVNIQVNAPPGSIGQLWAVDMTGKTMYKDEFHGALQKRLSVTTWPSGFYEIIISGDFGRIGKKLIISR